MARKRFSAEQIVDKLREAEVEIAKGMTIGQVCKKLGISEQTYYKWRREYGGMRTDQAKRLKELEIERDLLNALAKNNLDLNDEVGKYSSSPLVVANMGIKVHEAASIMAGKNIKRLGLTKDNLLSGMVTARDVVDAYQSVYQITNPYLEELSDYISG